MIITEDKIKDLLRRKPDGSLYHRESTDLEFKEQFSLSALAEYFKDFSSFANNAGGFLVFGVTNSPRKLHGLTKKSLEQFEKIDPEKISGFLLEIFSQNINWEQSSHKISGKDVGVFYIHEAQEKPIIAKKNEGKDNLIQNGDVYYRYGGRSQKIQYAELENIIQKRIEQQNSQWFSLMKKIAKIGPSNAAILDTENGLIEKTSSQVLVIDESLLSQIKFIREGSFSEKAGATTLKVVGNVQPINTIEVVKTREKNLLELFPLSAMQLFEEVKKKILKLVKMEYLVPLRHIT